MMFKIIDKLSVAIRKRDKCGYAIPCENTHTKKYKTDLSKIKMWARTNRSSDGSEIETIDIDNVPVKGFKLSSSFKRMGYFGSGNAIFRIADPRGFELELYQESFAKMLTDVTIINGEIQNECYWSKSGNMWVLIPVDSDEHKQYLVERDIHVTATLKPSEVAKLPHGTKIKYKQRNEIFEALYYGVVYNIDMKKRYDQSIPYGWFTGSTKLSPQTYDVSVRKRHLIKRTDTSEYRNGYSLESSLDVIEYTLPEKDDHSTIDDYVKINGSTLTKNTMYTSRPDAEEVKHSHSPFAFSNFHFITGHKLTKDNVTIEMVNVERLSPHFKNMVKKQKKVFLRKHGDVAVVGMYNVIENMHISDMCITYDVRGYTTNHQTYKPTAEDAHLVELVENDITEVLCVVHKDVIVPIQYQYY